MAPSSSAQPPRPMPRNRWRGPLVAGFCFGLGYGVTQRLLALQVPGQVQLRQGFEVREVPGTSLESLRLRYGSDTKEIRGDLELLELEQQAKQREQERQQEDKRRDEEEQRRQALEEQQADDSASTPQAGEAPAGNAAPIQPPAPALPEPSQP